VMQRKRRPADAEAEFTAALEALRIAGAARWEAEMAATTLVDSATLPGAKFFASLRGQVR